MLHPTRLVLIGFMNSVLAGVNNNKIICLRSVLLVYQSDVNATTKETMTLKYTLGSRVISYMAINESLQDQPPDPKTHEPSSRKCKMLKQLLNQ